MKRTVSGILCYIFIFLLLANVGFEASGQNMATGQKYDISEYQERLYQNYQSLLCGDFWDDILKGELLCAPITLCDNMKNDNMLQAGVNIATLAISGIEPMEASYSIEQAQESYYQKSLIALLKTMEVNLESAIENATTYDTKTSLKDNLIQMITAGVGAALNWFTSPKDVPAYLDVLQHMFDVYGIGSDLKSGLLENDLTVSQIKSLASQTERYIIFHNVLQTVSLYGDDLQLQHAAQALDDALKHAFTYYCQQGLSSVNKFIFDGAGFTIDIALDRIVSDKNYQNSTSLFELKVLQGILQLTGSFTAGVDLGVSICNFAIGSADTLAAYYDLLAMAGTEKALLTAIEEQKKAVHSGQDSESMLKIQEYLYALLYTDVRGIHAIDLLQQKDAGLRNGINNILGLNKEAESLLNACKEPILNVKNCIDDLFPDIENYRIENDNEICRFVDDFDGDGINECYYITGIADGSEYYSGVNIYAVDSSGNETCMTEGMDLWWCFSTSENSLITCAQNKYLVLEKTGGGSTSVSYIFGFKNGQPYQPEISGQTMFFRKTEDPLVCAGTGNDWSKGYHDYYDRWYRFDTDTLEFIEFFPNEEKNPSTEDVSSILGTWESHRNDAETFGCELISTITFNSDQTFSYCIGIADSGLADFYQGTYAFGSDGLLKLHWSKVENLDIGTLDISFDQVYQTDFTPNSAIFHQVSGKDLFFYGVGNSSGLVPIKAIPDWIHQNTSIYNEEITTYPQSGSFGNRIDLTEYLDSIEEMYSLIGGDNSEERGDHENWYISGNVQYGNYPESEKVDDIFVESKKYSLYKVIAVGENADTVKNDLLASGWQWTESYQNAGECFWEFSREDRSIRLNFTNNQICSYGFWRIPEWAFE